MNRGRACGINSLTMIASLGKERILHSFLNGSVPEFQRSFGTDEPGRDEIERGFRLRNMFPAIDESAHWALWRAVGIEHKLLGGDVNRRIGFDLHVGVGDGTVRMRYFPAIFGRNRDYPLQFAALYVSGGRQERGGVERIYNVSADLRSVTVIGRSLKFQGRIPLEHNKSATTLWIVPSGSRNDYTFRVGERGFVIKARPRRGSYMPALLPGFAEEPAEPEFEDVAYIDLH